MNEHESGIDCAKREVWEEIGFSIEGKISENVNKSYIYLFLFNYKSKKNKL